MAVVDLRFPFPGLVSGKKKETIFFVPGSERNSPGKGAVVYTFTNFVYLSSALFILNTIAASKPPPKQPTR